MERRLTRISGNALWRLFKKRPGLGLFLAAAAGVFLYFQPNLEDWPASTRPPDNSRSAGGSGAVSGLAANISDGDTLTVKTGNGEVKVRLYGIDAPEMMQARGRESKKFLARLVSGQSVKLEIKDRDQYGRLVARVFVDDKAVDAELVAAGQAWVYESHCKADHCRELRGLQAAAKENRRGLWRDQNPKPPWEWRKENTRD